MRRRHSPVSATCSESPGPLSWGTRWADRSSSSTAPGTLVMRLGLVIQSGFSRWDAARVVEGFRWVAGDEVAEIAGRFTPASRYPTTSGHLSQPHLARTSPMTSARRVCQRTSNSIHAAWTSSANSTSSLNSAAFNLRHWFRSASSTRSHLSPRPKRSSAPLPEGLAQLEIFEGAGHFTWMDTPDRYWPTIIDFIDRTTEPGGSAT